jgi:hypothetical protein
MAAIVWNAPILGSMAVCNLDEDAPSQRRPVPAVNLLADRPLPTALLDANGQEWRELANAG